VKFLCLICAERLLEQMTEAETRAHLESYRELTAALARSGQLVACERLLPAATAATVRLRRGRIAVTDGPFVETKEVIGGYFVLETRNRDEALEIAARIPGASIGCVEVRPIAADEPTLRALGRAPEVPD
jgi:hypothetical protein